MSEKTKLRRDGGMVKPGNWLEGIFVNNGADEPADRPTIFVSALVENDSDRKWFAEVLKAIEGVEVPR